MFYILLAIINVIILFMLYYNYNKKLHFKIEEKTQEYIKKEQQNLESIARQNIDHLKQREHDACEAVERKVKELKNLDSQFTSAMQRLDEVNTLLSTQRESAKTYEEQLREQARQSSKTYEEDLRKIAEAKVYSYEQEKFKAAELSHAETMATLGAQAEIARAQVESLAKEVEEYSAKQAAINEAIMRQRAIEEQQDFYRVCLASEVANDVELLNSIRRNLKKPEIIDKIIYDNYIAKPVLEMIKRVLQNSTCSGIYKITCIKTGEIYIGKSTDIKNRWQQHCKTVFNCGTIASSLLHTKMKQHGIENFTFELVEQVPKDQLSEREKFYINFYQTKEVGLNERNG